MPCVRTAGGIVCYSRGRQVRCACGAPAPFRCDWKVPTRKSGTCDKPICERCSTKPAAEKDLCPDHAVALSAWLSQRSNSAGTPEGATGS